MKNNQDIIKKLSAAYYKRQNLALILGSNRRTLDYRISRLIAQDILETIKPGFYINKKLLSASSQKEDLLEYVGSIAKTPSCVSLEYAMYKYGLIAESIYAITYITTKKTGVYSGKSVVYKYKNIKPILFTDYDIRTFSGSQFLFAKKYKALFDFIYLTPMSKSNEFRSLLFDSRFNWGAMSQPDLSSFRQLCLQSKSKKMAKVVSLLKQKGVINL